MKQSHPYTTKADAPTIITSAPTQKTISSLVCIVYDGIGSSVFHGQVLQPLLELKKKSPKTPVYIISFEHARDKKKAQKLIESKSWGTCQAFGQKASLAHKNNKNKNIVFILYTKHTFIGYPNLWLAARQLENFLRALPEYTIRARGPIAGAIALRAANKTECAELVIQARGLVAAEYLYDHEQAIPTHDKTLFARLVNLARAWACRVRAQQFKSLEKYVYMLHTHLPTTIEAVSPALKEYLIKEFDAPANKITIAQQDIPAIIAPELRTAWAREVRTELVIPESAQVYCYSGSIKPWQCPELTIEFFKQQLQKSTHSYLLVLTQDKKQFEKLLHESAITKTHYCVITVAHDQVYRYLSACNTGILFRKPHSVNWVSRPTKALEYRAAGLTIAHNNTVAYLLDQNYLTNKPHTLLKT